MTTLTLVALLAVIVGVAAGLAFAYSERDWRVRREERALSRQSRLSAEDGVIPILAALRSTVIMLDEDDDVLRASASAYAFNLVHDDVMDEPQIAAMVKKVRSTGVTMDEDIQVARGRIHGAGVFFLHVRVASIGRQHILILVEDRTSSRRLEAMRRDFVANVSHELKTPVGALSLLAETVEANAQNPDVVRQFSARMSKEAQRLGMLVNEIIELSRLQDGDALVSPETVELDEVITEAIDRVRIEAQARDIALMVGGEKNVTVRGDAALLTTAIRNLLDNAISYSNPHTRVSVGVSRTSDEVHVAVVDQGIGIASEDQERVFERFFRVDKARSRATGGTGLGLSIVKHVAADHGGTVKIWSALGQGSTFTLILPRSVDHPVDDDGFATQTNPEQGELS
ncbi:sensor histidine kinase [Actinomyces vulturis]|uniref:sensor histidine kinase n=1 Tax=Actinomyces vulturis TaxID=1857645 RepID=UPI0009F715AE|nr:ATP-binding protein [Actinomyces vulturis]